jgi:hypothetical protein
MERPANHHGTDRPEAKNSDVFFPDLLAKYRAGIKQTATAVKAMIQSSALRCIGPSFSALVVNTKRDRNYLSHRATD